LANREVLGVRPQDPGAVAQTRIIYNKTTGEIIEADIVLNPRYAFSTNQAFGAYDLQAIVTHEVGHALGCDHSSIPADTMYASISPEEFFQRNLSADAIAFASMTYPNPVRAAALGSITGRITLAGAGVFGASVTAVDLDRNQIYAAVSEPDGKYAIRGTPAGRYAIYAEPLDGPATPDQLLVQGNDAYYRGMNTSFRTVAAEDQLLGASGSARNLQVNLAVPAGASAINIDRMGRGDPDSGLGYLSAGPVAVVPGERTSLWIGGLNTWKVTSLDDIKILGTGLTVDPSRGPRILTGDNGSPLGVSVLVQVAADAAPGPRTVILSFGDQRAAITGGIVVAARAPQTSALYFPYLKASAGQYTGIALANAALDIPAVIRVSARDFQGALLWGADAAVPADITLGGGMQTARLEREFFNLSFGNNYSGSLVVVSDSPSVQGFFLTGDFAGTFLDGAGAFTRGYRQLVFLDALQDAGTSTEIHLLNIKDSPVPVDLTLVASDGSVLQRVAKKVIPARGKIGGTISNLFGIKSDLGSAHVTAIANDEALAGFSLIAQPAAIAGLNGVPIEDAGSVLYSPQFSIGDANFPMETRLNVVNAGDVGTQVSVALLDADGKPFSAETKTVVVGAGAQFSFDLRSTFMLKPCDGYIKVNGEKGSRLLGNVMFGSSDPTSGTVKYQATIPLSAVGSQDFLFCHIAQDSGYYTGLALLAPDGARITVTAFDRNGAPIGKAVMRDLAPGQRLVLLLSELIPETEGQLGGYVKVAADHPVIGFEMFGSANGQVLSAVPPQPLPKEVK
jgi:hypothetical protein